MKKLTSLFKNLMKDESGQGATEYILLLVVIVAVAMLFGGQIKETISSKMGELSSSIMEFKM